MHDNQSVKQYNIEFKLNDIEKIVVKLEEPLEEVGFIHFVPIVFESEHSYTLSSGRPSTLYGIMQDLEILLRMALDNNLQLHESLKLDKQGIKDIGYFFKKYF